MPQPIEWAGGYLLAVKDMVLFTLMVPGKPDWDDAESPYDTLAALECSATGALPSELA